MILYKAVGSELKEIKINKKEISNLFKEGYEVYPVVEPYVALLRTNASFDDENFNCQVKTKNSASFVFGDAYFLKIKNVLFWKKLVQLSKDDMKILKENITENTKEEWHRN